MLSFLVSLQVNRDGIAYIHTISYQLSKCVDHLPVQAVQAMFVIGSAIRFSFIGDDLIIEAVLKHVR